MVNVVYVEREPTPPPKSSRSKRRTPKEEVNPSHSLSIDHLPEWIRGAFEDAVLPTLLDHFGAQEDPWTVDPKPPAQPAPSQPDASTPTGLVGNLHDLITLLVPQCPRGFKLDSKDRIVRIVSCTDKAYLCEACD